MGQWCGLMVVLGVGESVENPKSRFERPRSGQSPEARGHRESPPLAHGLSCTIERAR